MALELEAAPAREAEVDQDAMLNPDERALEDQAPAAAVLSLNRVLWKEDAEKKLILNSQNNSFCKTHHALEVSADFEA